MMGWPLVNKKTDPPKIEFPCEDYPIKIVGEAGQVMQRFVIEKTQQYAPGFDQSKITVKTSREGRFQSITVLITATGEEQLKAYHQALVDHPAIKLVL